MRFFKKKVNRKVTVASLANRTNANQPEPLPIKLSETLRVTKEMHGNSTDLVTRVFRIGQDGYLQAGIIYIDGLADTKAIHDFIMSSLMIEIREANLDETAGNYRTPLELLRDFSLPVSNMKSVTDFESLSQEILSGHTIIALDGYSEAFSVSTEGWEDRGVQEPESQTVVRGPREGFSENIRTNTTLLRRKIKNSRLWLETKQIGQVTKTNVSIMYIQGIANEKVVTEVRTRLDRIKIDGILESGNIEELIQDETYTPFPTVYHTERPDVVAAGLLEGRVAILVDGTPFVLLVPALFIQFFQSAEDYYQRSDIGSLLRLLRYLSFFISLVAPSAYIAITTFHQEMLPTSLLLSLAAQREGIPFPAFAEAVLMEITFEILREAGVRLPRAVGQAVSIVGALVIGQAAVEAGIVSPSMVIVVSITAISNFTFPAFNMGISIRMLRFPLMLLAASFGLYGILIGLIAFVLHVCSLRSFGIPYMTPIAPFVPQDQKDTMIRSPIWAMVSRPRLLSQKNITRGKNGPTPKP